MVSLTRRVIIFIVSIVALTGSLTAAFATLNERDFQLRGYVDATQNANLPYRIPRLGVNAELTQYKPEELEQHLSWMQEANVVWIRQIVRWDEIEITQEQYKWETWDTIFQTLDNYPDLQLIPVFMNTPAWAREVDSITAPPAEPEDFAEFVRVFAERYGDYVHYYQVWDEPNLDDAWGGLDPRPAQYAALLSAAYSAIHSADPHGEVIAAALAPTTETGGDNISDILYLRELYQLGLKEFSDAIAAKPYGFDSPSSDRRIDPNTLNFSRIVALREIMVEFNDGQTPLWASNWGWNALREDWSGSPSIWGAVSESERASFTLEALERAEREWAWLGGMILYHWQPDAEPNDPVWGFSIIDPDHQPSELWTALAEREISSVATNGLYHPITPFANYSGLWTFGELGADIGWLETSDSHLKFKFEGQDIALLLREGDYVAFLYPTINGSPANALPQDNAGNSYIFLRSDNLERTRSLVSVATDLQNSTHLLEVIADRGWDQWALAGYAVSSGDLATPYNTQITAALLTSFIALIAVIFSGVRVPWKRILSPLHQIMMQLDEVAQFGISTITSIALMLGLLLTFGEGAPQIFRRDIVQYAIPIVLTGGMVALEFPFILAIIGCLILFVFIFNKLEVGLLLTILYAPFFLYPVELYTFAFPMSEILVLMTFAAWLLKSFAQWGRNRQSQTTQYQQQDSTLEKIQSSLLPIDYGVVALLILGVISLTWAGNRSFAFTEYRTMFIEPALFYLLLRTMPLNRKIIIRLIDTLLLAGLLVCVIGLWGYITGNTVITAEEGTRRLASVYGSPNNVGLFLGRCVPFALAFVLIPINRNRRLFASVTLLIMLITVALTVSIGAILIGVPIAIAVVILLSFGKRAFLPIAALTAIGVGIVSILVNVSARFASLLDLTQGTNFIRLRVWESGINIIRENPIRGIGLDQFLYLYRGQFIRPDAIWDQDLSHPHNFLLDFWIRLGFFGVLIFLFVQYHFWSMCLKTYRHFRNTDRVIVFAIIVGCMGSMANLLAHGLVDNSVFVLDLVYVFMLILGVVSHLSLMRAIDVPRE